MADPGTVRHWKSSLITAADDAFFDIVHGYLGELKTPFNKHDLIERLAKFLGKKETRHRIAELLDDEDKELLTAIYVLQEPTMTDLYSFFDNRLQYIELHNRVSNMEERLIVYRDSVGEGHHIRFNPVLKSLILSVAVDVSGLFPSREQEHPPNLRPWIDDSLLISSVAFLMGGRAAVKSDGTWKKKALDELAIRIPPLADVAGKDAASSALTRGDLLMRSLMHLGLATQSDRKLRPDYQKWEEFAELERSDRLAYLVAAAWVELEGTRDHPEDLCDQAASVSAFLSALTPNRSYPRESLFRVLGTFGGHPVHGRAAERLVDAACILGFVAEGTDGWLTPLEFPPNDPDQTASAGERDEPPVVCQPNFELAMKPWIPLREGVFVASIADILQHDVYPRFEITRRSFSRCLDLGIDPQEAVDRLLKITGERLPENIRFSLETWIREFSGVSLFRGTVLVVEEGRRHLVEHAAAMKPFIRNVVAPGVYLLEDEQSDRWRRALEQAGVSPVPPILSVGASSEEGRTHTLAALGRRDRGEGPLMDAPQGTHHGQQPSTGLGERVDAKFEAISLPQDQKNELAAKIRKKLILFPSQLRPARTKSEKTEVRGFDYLGKVRLVEQTLSSPDGLLEIIDQPHGSDPQRTLVRPEEIEKRGSDLVLIGKTVPDNEPIRVKIRKIGLLRKVRGSLFGP